MQKFKKIGGLLSLLSSSVLTAVAICAYLIYYHGPSGTHKMTNVLLAPEMLNQMNYQEINPQTGNGPRMVFDHFEYIHTGSDGRKWRSELVSKTAYMTFYDVVRDERSFLEVSPAIHEAFQRGGLSTLALMVRPEGGGAGETRTFQQIHFSPEGDYLRVELRLDTKGKSFAYFHKEGITQKVNEIFLRAR